MPVGGPLRAPCERDSQVAPTAQQPVVVEPAFAAAVGNGHDVIRFPPRALGAPGPPHRAISRRRFRAGPFAMRLDDIEAAQPARALVALLYLLPHIPRAAPDLPLVHARVAAERPARRLHRATAPPADRLSRLIALGLSPVIRGHHTLTTGAHTGDIGMTRVHLYERITEGTESTEKANHGGTAVTEKTRASHCSPVARRPTVGA